MPQLASLGDFVSRMACFGTASLMGDELTGQAGRRMTSSRRDGPTRTISPPTLLLLLPGQPRPVRLRYARTHNGYFISGLMPIPMKGHHFQNTAYRRRYRLLIKMAEYRRSMTSIIRPTRALSVSIDEAARRATILIPSAIRCPKMPAAFLLKGL